jgi:hypothetical protein
MRPQYDWSCSHDRSQGVSRHAGSSAPPAALKPPRRRRRLRISTGAAGQDLPGPSITVSTLPQFSGRDHPGRGRRAHPPGPDYFWPAPAPSVLSCHSRLDSPRSGPCFFLLQTPRDTAAPGPAPARGRLLPFGGCRRGTFPVRSVPVPAGSGPCRGRAPCRPGRRTLEVRQTGRDPRRGGTERPVSLRAEAVRPGVADQPDPGLCPEVQLLRSGGARPGDADHAERASAGPVGRSQVERQRRWRPDEAADFT